MLQRNGFNTLKASDGLQGIDTALHEKVDVILCEEQLSDMEGFDLLRLLKSFTATMNIPFIMVSEKSPGLENVGISETGHFGHLLIPFTEEELLNTLKLDLIPAPILS